MNRHILLGVGTMPSRMRQTILGQVWALTCLPGILDAMAVLKCTQLENNKATAKDLYANTAFTQAAQGFSTPARLRADQVAVTGRHSRKKTYIPAMRAQRHTRESRYVPQNDCVHN